MLPGVHPDVLHVILMVWY